jgi:L-serine dehydratase
MPTLFHTRTSDADMPRVHATDGDPIDAARRFALALQDDGLLPRTWRVKCELHGDLARTLCKAVMLGLEGGLPASIEAPAIAQRLRRIEDKRELRLLGTRRIAFDKRHHLVFRRGGEASSPAQSIRLSAFDPRGMLLLEKSYEFPRD